MDMTLADDWDSIAYIRHTNSISLDELYDKFQHASHLREQGRMRAYTTVPNAFQRKSLGHAESMHDNESTLRSGQTLGRWAMLAFVGLCCGMTAFLLKESIGYIFERRRDLLMSVVTYAMQDGSLWSWLQAFAAVFGAAGLLAFVSAALVVWWSPNSAGSGIPETMAYLNGIVVPDTFTVKVG